MTPTPTPHQHSITLDLYHIHIPSRSLLSRRVRRIPDAFFVHYHPRLLSHIASLYYVTSRLRHSFMLRILIQPCTIELRHRIRSPLTCPSIDRAHNSYPPHTLVTTAFDEQALCFDQQPRTVSHYFSRPESPRLCSTATDPNSSTHKIGRSQQPILSTPVFSQTAASILRLTSYPNPNSSTNHPNLQATYNSTSTAASCRI